MHITKNEFHTQNHWAPKSVGPVAIATFATIVNPALSLLADALLHQLCPTKTAYRIKNYVTILTRAAQ